MTHDLFGAANRRILVLNKGRERSITNRHPWVFTGAIAREQGPVDAAIADLVDVRGQVLASGLYSPNSQIRLRALTFGEPLTADWLRERLLRSFALRAPLLDGATSALRLVNSEGDGLSGITIDQYDDALAMELSCAGADRLRELILEVARAAKAPRTIVIKNDLPARRLEKLPLDDELVGEERSHVEVLENGRRFRVEFRGAQKTGFFLDQRENRAIAGAFAFGRNVLNVFSYSGGFGVCAAAAGAVSVEEVDVSLPAIDLARENHRLNPSTAGVSFVVADAFDYLRHLVREGRRFDLVICDPPAFAKSRGEVDRAARGYKDINLQAFKLVAPGGHLMTFSCSGHVGLDLFQKIIFSAALDAHRDAAIVKHLGAGIDHPVSIYCPEGEYLKGLMLRV